MKVHKHVTVARVSRAVRRAMTSLDNPGFCTACGKHADGVEPDARGYACAAAEDEGRCAVSGRRGGGKSAAARVARRERAERCRTCPHCEYDRLFPGFEGGGWMQQDNNGPIVSCPLCNAQALVPRK